MVSKTRAILLSLSPPYHNATNLILKLKMPGRKIFISFALFQSMFFKLVATVANLIKPLRS